MNKKITADYLISTFLTTRAESEGYTDKKEIAQYVKDGKKDMKKIKAKKGVK